MSDQSTGGSPASSRDPNLNPPGTSDPPPKELALQGRPSATQEAKSGTDEAAAATTKKLQPLEMLNIVTNLGLVVVGIVAASIYGCQLGTMNSQLTAMQAANRVTGQAAYAACVGSQISRAAFIASVGANKDAHDAAIAETYQTIVATKSEAAHITLNSGTISFGHGLPVTAPFSLRNDGKTAAYNVVAKARIVFVAGSDDTKLTYTSGGSIYSETPYLEAGAEPLNLRQNPNVLTLRGPTGVPRISTENDQADLQNARKFILVFARATYKDALGIRHWVDFCRTVPPASNLGKDQRAPEKCIRYNGEDHNSAVARRPAEPSRPLDMPEINCPVPKGE